MKKNNYHMFFLIFILILTIIVNTMISNFYNEDFLDIPPNKLIFLYDSNDKNCPQCKNIKNNIWPEIEKKALNAPFTYKYRTESYDINKDTEGINLRNLLKINTSPSIIFKKSKLRLDSNNKEQIVDEYLSYDNNTSDFKDIDFINDILKWTTSI